MQHTPLMFTIVFVSTILAAVILTPLAGCAAEEKSPQRFESDIQRFEAKDIENPPPKDGILFTGSSTIRMWKVELSFPGLPVFNRGFGGSTYADLKYYMPRVIFPYAPRLIVLYTGDNDLAHGASVQTVFDDFKAVVDAVHEHLPNTRILLIGIKPGTARWKLWDKAQETNALFQHYAAQNPFITYVDCGKVLLGEDGLPRKDLFLEDGLHLNDKGYAEWNKIIAPLLKVDAPTAGNK